MASSFWTFSRQALVPRLFRDYSPSLDRGQAGAHRTQLPDELLTSKSWFILLICATTAHFQGIDVNFTARLCSISVGWRFRGRVLKRGSMPRRAGVERAERGFLSCLGIGLKSEKGRSPRVPGA